MPAYDITEACWDGTQTRLAPNPTTTITASDAHEALAKFSMQEGFADPRQFIGQPEDFFFTLADGNVGMVFTNTSLVAVPAVA